jgi:flavin reductase (DIM6/NTAB) family NADH-FMN oxidoreductase RutF
MTNAAATFCLSRLSAQSFRATMGCFPTGVAVLTARSGEWSHGMTVNSVTSVSLQPLLVLACVRRLSTMDSLLTSGSPFGLSVLSEHQRSVAAYFADPARPPGQVDTVDIPCHAGPATGMPLICDAVAWLECHVSARHPGGDHTIVVGQVAAAFGEPDRDSIVFFRGGYRRLDEQLLPRQA